MIAEVKTITIFVLPFSDPLRAPHLMVYRVTSSAVEYRVQNKDDTTNALITGYEVIRQVPMIGEYVNTGGERRVRISPAVPGAQYKVTAWVLGGGNRSATPWPAVLYVTTGEARECGLRTSLYSISGHFLHNILY